MNEEFLQLRQPYETAVFLQKKAQKGIPYTWLFSNKGGVVEGLKQKEKFVTVNYVGCQANQPGNLWFVFKSAVFISALRGFFLMTFGQKIAICAIFVFIRADEYHKTLTDVLRKVSVSNVGLLETPNFIRETFGGCPMSQHGSTKQNAMSTNLRFRGISGLSCW